VSHPRRVKIQGDLYHGQVPPGAVYVGRQAPGLRRSPFANPFPVGEHCRDGAISLFYEHLLTTPSLLDAAHTQLAGRDLACWCKTAEACHGDLLLYITNGDNP
jgi:glutaminase